MLRSASGCRCAVKRWTETIPLTLPFKHFMCINCFFQGNSWKARSQSASAEPTKSLERCLNQNRRAPISRPQDLKRPQGAKKMTVSLMAFYRFCPCVAYAEDRRRTALLLPLKWCSAAVAPRWHTQNISIQIHISYQSNIIHHSYIHQRRTLKIKSIHWIIIAVSHTLAANPSPLGSLGLSWVLRQVLQRLRLHRRLIQAFFSRVYQRKASWKIIYESNTYLWLYTLWSSV